KIWISSDHGLDLPRRGINEPMNRWTDGPIRRIRPAFLLVAAAALISFFVGLGSIPITSPNEGLYAEVAREMAAGASPIIPRANDVIYLEKPPLLYWLAALSMRTFGENAIAVRLPSALAALATALLVAAAGRRLVLSGGPCGPPSPLGSRRTGVLSGVIFATSMGLVIVARQVIFDSLLTLWITLALLSFWFGTAEEDAGNGRGLLAVGYASLALALLTKGLVGVALPALIVLTYVLIS